MNIYCVYLTIYNGKLLPPFYIGSKDKNSILKGYRGSVTSKEYKDIFKSELKQNPHLFKYKIISEHTSRFDEYQKEKKLQSALNVIENPLYINKSIAYGPVGLSNKGRKFTKEHKENLSQSQIKRYKERGNPNLGKKYPPASDDRKRKISLANKGKPGWRLGMTNSPEMRKKQSESAKNREFFNCPKCNKRLQKAHLVRYHGLNGSKCRW